MKAIARAIVDRGRADPVTPGAALIAGKKVAPDATLLLMQDHREAMNYFDWAERASDALSRQSAIRKLALALWAHMQVEEELVYPAARNATGDEQLVDHAYEEHGEAKRLLEQLTETDAGTASDDTLRGLRTAIEQHVLEEETELFPKLRATSVDLYKLGAMVAARRVQVLSHIAAGPNSKSPDTLESQMTPINPTEAHDLFVVGLRNAHASAGQCKEMTERQLERVENYPQVLARLQAHLPEKEAQLARIERILESFGESPSALKDTAMAMMGNMTSVFAMPAGDEIIKNSLAGFAQANFEIAALEGLLVMGEAAGHIDAIRELQLSLSEERAMAAWLAENLRGVILMHMQLRSEGQMASR